MTAAESGVCNLNQLSPVLCQPAYVDHGKMMRNRLTLTISDIHGSRHYSVHKVAKKIAFYAVISIAIAFVGTIGVLQFLNNEVAKLEGSNTSYSQTIIGLNDENTKLISEISIKENLLVSNMEKLRFLNDEVRKLEGSNVDFSQTINGLHDKNNELIADISDKEGELVLITEKLENIETLIGLKPRQEMDIHQRVELANITLGQKLLLLQNIPSGGPLEKMRTTGRYGMRMHPVTGKKTHHAGVDLRAKMNTPVYATADGVVEYAMLQKKSGYGKLLLIRHNYGFKTVYGHLNKFKVKYGDFVKKGDLIAYTGNSGLSNGPHLHYEIRYIYRTLDPVNFVSWDLENYDAIFDREKKIKWLSLIQAVTRQAYPLPQPLLHTALQ